MKYLQKQTKPKGVDLADDEIILHVEGTMASQRVVRHIKKTSWPGLVFQRYLLMLRRINFNSEPWLLIS